MKQIIKITLLSLLIFSCNEKVKNENKKEVKKDKIQIESSNKEGLNVDFFDKKYFNGYMISFGDEDISEHPYRYYYNYENKQVQWFAISYVPKDISLSNYWLNYLQGSNGDKITESSVIEKKVNKDLNAYNIFAVYIPKKYLDISNGASKESMFFKNNTEVYFYLYDIAEKKWKFLKKAKTNSPLIGERDFFYKQFPELFPTEKSSKLNNNKNIDDNENSTLSKNFVFKFSTSKFEDENENERQKIKISVKSNETSKIQELNFTPESLVMEFDARSSNSISYFDPKIEIIKSAQEIEGGYTLIALDVNFDGLEDFAIINYEGSNGGPQYAYYIQKPNKQFALDSYLTENVRFFPIEINNNKKIIIIAHPSGCCQIQTDKYQIQRNGKWKNIYSNLEDMK